MKNIVEKFIVTLFTILLCHLQAAEDKPSLYEKHLGFFELLDRGRSNAYLFVDGESDQKIWDNYFKESPGIIDQYIKEGARMQEIMNDLSEHGEYGGLRPKTFANISLRDYVRFFSRDLAYYDPALSPEKKTEAAQALISALKARPYAASPEPYIGAQSEPLAALGHSYLLSPWRHRPEVIEYVQSVEFTDRIAWNKGIVKELTLLHENLGNDALHVPATKPNPRFPFPVHPAVKARAEAAAQAKRDRKNASPAPDPAPAPPPLPPAVSFPAPAPAASPAKPSRASWWILSALAVLGVATTVMRKKKPQG